MYVFPQKAPGPKTAFETAHRLTSKNLTLPSYPLGPNSTTVKQKHHCHLKITKDFTFGLPIESREAKSYSLVELKDSEM